MTKLVHNAWVLIADGEKALFLRNEGDEKHPNLAVFREEGHENPPAREWGESRPGRFSDGPSGHRSAVEVTDWHELEKERFASDLADILYKKAHAGKFDRIVLVAGPETLGELRDHLHREVASRVIGEVAKTLTNHPVDRIQKIVCEELAGTA